LLDLLAAFIQFLPLRENNLSEYEPVRLHTSG
jgi:hypothetical protein